MNTHITNDQLIQYACRTLTDTQRETMDIHLAACQMCRAELAQHETLQRRIRYAIIAQRKQASPSANMTFSGIAPQLKRSERMTRAWKQIGNFWQGAAALVAMMVLAFGLMVILGVLRPTDFTAFNWILRGNPAPDNMAPRQGNLVWSLQRSIKIPMTPAVIDGEIYIVSNAGDNLYDKYCEWLYRLDAQTGETKQITRIDRVITSSPTVSGKMIYVGGSNGHLYAFDSQTSQLKWVFETQGFWIESTPTVVDGIVYFGGPDRHLYALDGQTGQEIWKFKTGGTWIRSSPAVADGMVYFGSDDKHLYALNSQTGQEIWRFETGARIDSSPAVAGKMVYIGSKDGHTYALNSQTGALIWKFKTDGMIVPSPIVAGDTVYVGSDDHHLYALDSQTGQEIWKFKTEAAIQSSPTVASDTVYVGSDDHHLYALDSQTGQEIWKFKTQAEIVSSPIVVNGTVYFEDKNGVYAVR
jgi:outer membrane protein assembly factor BamB